MRRLLVISIVALVSASFPALSGAHGYWLTLKQASAQVREQTPLRASLSICFDSNCYEDEYGQLIGGDRLSVRVQGMRWRITPAGRTRLIKGQRRWQHFRVTGCGWVYSENTAVSFSFVFHGGTEIGYGNDPTPELRPVDTC